MKITPPKVHYAHEHTSDRACGDDTGEYSASWSNVTCRECLYMSPVDEDEVTITVEKHSELKRHSVMLGRIASIVEDYCDEHNTTLDGVKFLEAEKDKYKALYLGTLDR